MTSKLEPYEPSGKKLHLVQRCFSERAPILPLPYNERPKPSELRARILDDLSGRSDGTHHLSELMELVLRSVHRAWDNFYEGPVSPSDFLRTPIGAAYEIVSMAGKGRGVIASRDITAGEIILREAPVIVLPPGESNMLLLLTLPQKALEAVILLHNQEPEYKRASLRRDIPTYRLLDYLQGVVNTNAWTTPNAPYGGITLLLLTGSMFNHSDTPNITSSWDTATEQKEFMSIGDIKKCEELEVDYLFGVAGTDRAELLKGYGL
ncbi:hypothetical protein DL98DRAFT_295895 [Cadophora sp. DSE1049]|nr:hypothetical protein DL98DRAFT_295895 [Cadophora sp. DSE1049]